MSPRGGGEAAGGEMIDENAPVESKSQAQIAYETIKRTILRWDLVPGEHVSELQLSTSFGFGRAAMRSALTRLSHERLIRPIPRHGYVIEPLTLKHVRDMFGVRLVVEPAAARLAAQLAGEDEIAAIEEINQRCAHRSGPIDELVLRDANKEFHVALVRSSGNERLAEITSAALDDLQRILYLPSLNRVPTRIDATFDEHGRILSAIRNRDPDRAEIEMRDHVAVNKDSMIEVLLSSPLLQTINLGAGIS
jgi:DNA-binding GntR family transcriptional regulator